MDYNFWDDRTYDLNIDPCEGCSDYVNGICISDGGCSVNNDEDWEVLR